MASTKKGNDWYFGMKAHIGVVHSLDTSTAKLHDSQVWDDLLHGEETSVWDDLLHGEETSVWAELPLERRARGRVHRARQGLGRSALQTIPRIVCLTLELRKAPKGGTKPAKSAIEPPLLAPCSNQTVISAQPNALIRRSLKEKIAPSKSGIKHLIDEPLSNLDAELRVHMRLELKRLHKRLVAMMIYFTHDQVEAMTLADKIVVLPAGRVEQIGAPQTLFRRSG